MNAAAGVPTALIADDEPALREELQRLVLEISM